MSYLDENWPYAKVKKMYFQSYLVFPKLSDQVSLIAMKENVFIFIIIICGVPSLLFLYTTAKYVT